jgi:hypothetical protein
MNTKINLDEILNDPIMGIIFAAINIKVYNILTNQSPFHLNNYRIHHYQIGLMLLILTILKKNPFVIGYGSWLILHDMDDLIKDFKKFFKN